MEGAFGARNRYSRPMCLIAFAWRAHPRWPLVMIANRDEFHARPTAAADFLDDAPDVFGGIDLRAGGSWLLVSKRRRLAAVTNVRVGLAPEAAPRSRGELVKAFATADVSAAEFSAGIAPHAHAFDRFNLLLWDGESLHSVGNHPQFHSTRVAPGLHALSNAGSGHGLAESAARESCAFAVAVRATRRDPGKRRCRAPVRRAGRYDSCHGCRAPRYRRRGWRSSAGCRRRS